MRPHAGRYRAAVALPRHRQGVHRLEHRRERFALLQLDDLHGIVRIVVLLQVAFPVVKTIRREVIFPMRRVAHVEARSRATSSSAAARHRAHSRSADERMLALILSRSHAAINVVVDHSLSQISPKQTSWRAIRVQFSKSSPRYFQSESMSGPSSGILLSRIHICTAFIISLLRRMAVGKGVPRRTFSSKKYSVPSF